jgi:hypothetical protein
LQLLSEAAKPLYNIYNKVRHHDTFARVRPTLSVRLMDFGSAPDKTDGAKCRAEGSGLKGTIVGLTATFTIFSVNQQARDRVAGGDNFLVRIVRIKQEGEDEATSATDGNVVVRVFAQK